MWLSSMAKLFLLFTVVAAQFISFSHAAVTQQEMRWAASLKEITAQPEPFEYLPGDEDTVTIFTMHGSNTVGGSLGPAMVKQYLKAKGAEGVEVIPLEEPNEKVIRGFVPDLGRFVQVRIEAHGSSTGFKGLIEGEAQIWAASRPAKNKEISEAKAKIDLTSPDSEHILGIDGLAIVVNASNPLDSLSKKQLRDIFSGAINNWSQIGGADQSINLYARDDKSGTWDSFKNMVLAKKAALADSAIRFESSEQLVKNVVMDQGGIGFVGMAFVGESKLLAISDGPAQAFKPSDLTVATEDYALSRRLFLYTKDEVNNEFVREFMSYAQGVEGQKVVKKEGFISQNVAAMNMGLGDDLPTDYIDLVKGAKRLSVNFRFQEGSAKLDNKALKDIQRLAYFMKKEGVDKKVLLIGFGDKRKNEQRSKLLSKLRAMAVRRELARLGIHPKATTGYGDFNPIASFEGASRIKNRRVEVWVR